LQYQMKALRVIVTPFFVFRQSALPLAQQPTSTAGTTAPSSLPRKSPPAVSPRRAVIIQVMFFLRSIKLIIANSRIMVRR
jgi:hypothetical protein